MRKIQMEKADAAQLREEFGRSGLGAVTVSEPDARGRVTVSVPDGVDGILVDAAVQRHPRRLLIQRIRQAKAGTAELRDAVADALDALL